ncbi:unnamed protein product [Cuscuta campestris]|uniref:Reverse transcriptase zinc-binding domain-containing protein n=1 Tax=Cuscuta campestris TaxID=132261 RepID=A0A484LS16_9ASTE|nr:unnamed protein product [Cuscuta campestris]
MDIVTSSWGQGYQGDGMRGLAFKLADPKRALLQWNKDVFGNIFEEVSKAEERVLRAEQNLENDEIVENVVECNMARALLQLAHKKEESFWSQKANIKWISQGDASTAFFHSFVRGRRHRLCISSIKTAAGTLTSSQEEIAKEAVDHFSRVFSHVHEGILSDRLKNILPLLISPEHAAFQPGKGINEHVRMVKEMMHLLSFNARESCSSSYGKSEADCRNLLRLKAALSTFNLASGQEINFSKSQVIVHDKMRAGSISNGRFIWVDGAYSFGKVFSHWDPRNIGKVSLFLWRGVNRLLPFPYHLQRLQILVDAACPFCLESEVTDHHILVTCREFAAI